jgi:hypothetical protein
MLDPIVDGSEDYTKGNRLASSPASSRHAVVSGFGNTMLMWSHVSLVETGT